MSDNEKKTERKVPPIGNFSSNNVDEFIANLKDQLPYELDESALESLREVYKNLDMSQVGSPTVVKIDSDVNEVKVVYKDNQNENKVEKES